MLALSSGVAHCPLSNFYFADAVFPAKKALTMGVGIGLGTDISAGYSPSVFDSAKTAVVAARALQSGTNAQLAPGVRGIRDSQINLAEAFWMATSGAGEVLKAPIGKFEPGYDFDAIVIDTQTRSGTPLVELETDDDLLAFQRLFLLATRSNIVQTWVRGKKVSESEPSC
jgi:guanine deaminase